MFVGCSLRVHGHGHGRERVRAEPERTRWSSAPTTAAAFGPLRVLQFNLCNSGDADCYTGRSIAQAASVIQSELPDLVTLNEICQDDLPDLQRALADVVPDQVVSAFQASRNRRTGDVSRRRIRPLYGIGLVSRWPAAAGSSAGGGIYPTTDTRAPEERAWLCLTVAASPVLTVCTTHLAHTGTRTLRLRNAGICSAP